MTARVVWRPEGWEEDDSREKAPWHPLAFIRDRDAADGGRERTEKSTNVRRDVHLKRIYIFMSRSRQMSQTEEMRGGFKLAFKKNKNIMKRSRTSQPATE